MEGEFAVQASTHKGVVTPPPRISKEGLTATWTPESNEPVSGDDSRHHPDWGEDERRGRSIEQGVRRQSY